MDSPIDNLWYRLRGLVKECLTFNEIKDAAGSAGFPLQRLAHLQQKQLPERGSSKGELFDEIDRLRTEMSEANKRELVSEMVRHCLRKRPGHRLRLIQQLEKAGFGWNDFGELIMSGNNVKTEHPPTTKPAPFISYAREDANTAERLYHDLEANGADPWFDREKLIGGQNWEAAIREAIRNCSHFLALISENSVNKRGFVQRELGHALEILEEFPPDAIFVVPVRIDSSSPKHERLRQLHWIDLFPNYELGLERILESLGIRTAKGPSKEDPTRTMTKDTLDEVRARIRACAEKDHPDDFSTRKYVIDTQLADWRKVEEFSAPDLPRGTLSSIIQRAKADHPEDFSTQLYVIENETSAWRELQNFHAAGPPADVLDKIKSKAAHEHPSDFGTQLYVINNEIAAWKDLYG